MHSVKMYLERALPISLGCFLLVQTSGCSTGQKVPPVVTTTGAGGDVPEYLVRGRYPAKVPAWAEDFDEFKRAAGGKGVSYFLGESGDAKDRIAGCQLASIFAKQKVAEQIAQLVTGRIGAARAGGFKRRQRFADFRRPGL